jgi:transposase
MYNYSTYSNFSVARYAVPLRKGYGRFHHTEISPQAEMRLKWMDYMNKGNSVAKAARHFDYPYSTIKFWRDRYNKYNLSSLEDKSSRPHKVRKSELTREQRSIIIHSRIYDLPGAGKKTLQKFIENEYGIKIGQSAIQKVIHEAKLTRVKKTPKKNVLRKNKQHMYSVPKRYMNIPGGLVYLDVKHLKINRSKYYQFTALDNATRVLRVKVHSKITAASTVEFVKYLQKDFPFKKIYYIGTDNGSEFLGDLDEYLRKEHIKHVHSSPASPKQNPFVERVIRTIIDDVYDPFGLEDTAELQQDALDEYMKRYNEKRPHQGINLFTPMQMYAKLSCYNPIP